MPGTPTAGPFAFYSSPLDYNAAEAHCVAQGGHLASIHSMSENAMVHDLCTPSECWIGYNDIATEGTWVWSDGSAGMFGDFPGGVPPWNPGEPNGNPDEPTDGAYMYPATNPWVTAGTWDDDDITKAKAFACRFPPPPPSPMPPPMPTTAAGYRYELVHAGVECKSADKWYGKTTSAAECAQVCGAAKDCRFFTFGTSGSKLGDCYRENTRSADCPEGWEVDSFDFYELQAPWVGCTEPRARNYDPQATADSGTCEEWDACASGRREWGGSSGWVGDCQQWRGWCNHPCESGNAGYRNKKNDTVYAARVPPGSVTIDGDLREWATQDPRWRYSDVPFASISGDEVVFETRWGGKWFGPQDFSTSWMLRWDDDHLYIALEVIDDTFNVGVRDQTHLRTYCWQTGLQLGFEVGGPSAPTGSAGGPGILQARRSDSLDISRLTLMNVGFHPGQTSCLTRPNMSAAGSAVRPDSARDCCIEYVLNQGGGWMRLSRAAMIRNENSKRTTIELALSKWDLLPQGEAEDRWAERLRFGFAMAMNDGDDVARQRGWGGYYPSALVKDWNDGQKSPSKSGVLQLAGAGTPPAGARGSGGTSFFGTFDLLVFIAALLGGAYLLLQKCRKGDFPSLSLPSVSLPRARTDPSTSTARGGGLAAADGFASTTSYTAPLPTPTLPGAGTPPA
jgi:hypothetical protein